MKYRGSNPPSELTGSDLERKPQAHPKVLFQVDISVSSAGSPSSAAQLAWIIPYDSSLKFTTAGAATLNIGMKVLTNLVLAVVIALWVM